MCSVRTNPSDGGGAVFFCKVLREHNIIALLFQQKICSQYNSAGFKSVRFIFGCRGAVVVVVLVIFLGHFSRRIYACNYQEVEAVLLRLVLFVGVFLWRSACTDRPAHETACALPAVAMRPFWQRKCNISILPCLWLRVGATVATPHTSQSMSFLNCLHFPPNFRVHAHISSGCRCM